MRRYLSVAVTNPCRWQCDRKCSAAAYAKWHSVSFLSHAASFLSSSPDVHGRGPTVSCGSTLFFSSLRPFSTSVVHHSEEPTTYAFQRCEEDDEECSFLKDMDRIIASSSCGDPTGSAVPPTPPSASSTSSSVGGSGAPSGTAVSVMPVTLLKQWSNQVYRHYGRRPRLLLSFLHRGPTEQKKGHDLAPFLADVGFDVDICPPGQSPSAIARSAVEADVHGVLLLHSSCGNFSSITQEMEGSEMGNVATSPSDNSVPSTAAVENVEEALSLLSKELKDMKAEDVFLFYVDKEKVEGEWKRAQPGAESSQENIQKFSTVLANPVLYFRSMGSPNFIAATILQSFLEVKESP